MADGRRGATAGSPAWQSMPSPSRRDHFGASLPIVASIGIEHESDAANAAHDGRLLLRRDSVRDRVVSPAALHLQLHRLPAGVGQRVRAQYAGSVQGFSHPAGCAEAVAPYLAERGRRHIWFCGDCGGRLYGDRAGRAEIVSLRAGTLDDTSWLAPAAHMFTRSAQPWVRPAAGAECHETESADFRAAAEIWRGMWPEF
jgi:hypothetical protein